MYLPQGIQENEKGAEEEPMGLSTFMELLGEEEPVKEAKEEKEIERKLNQERVPREALEAEFQEGRDQHLHRC